MIPRASTASLSTNIGGFAVFGPFLPTAQRALGGSVAGREGSRVRINLEGEQWRAHRPHPGKEAKRYQVEEVRVLLERPTRAWTWPAAAQG